MSKIAAETILNAVRDRYAAVAASGLSNDSRGVQAVAEAFGYTAEELRSLPAEANMGLSCGNPLATAHLQPGETVVELGSGGGLDLLLAARRVGPTGRAIGIDMTDAMLERARRNAAQAGATNVVFHKATIDTLPLENESVDCVLSNCVINLAPDKRAVFREIARVLRPGGRIAISDIALKQPLPPEIGQDLLAYVGCIAGAIPIEEYRQGLRDAGFAHVEIFDTKADLNAYSQIEGQVGCCGEASAHVSQPVEPACCAPAAATGTDTCCTPAELHEAPATDAAAYNPASETAQELELIARLQELARRYNLNDYAASVLVFAVKP